MALLRLAVTNGGVDSHMGQQLKYKRKEMSQGEPYTCSQCDCIILSKAQLRYLENDVEDCDEGYVPCCIQCFNQILEDMSDEERAMPEEDI